MTVETQLEDFVYALRDQLESARLVADDSNQFLDIMHSIENQLATAWPPLSDSIWQGELRAEHRVILEQIVELLTSLEARTRSRLVWLGDFEDYMRRALDTRS